MNSSEKKIIKIFVYMAEPNDFINSAEKLMANEFIKGCCLSFLESGAMEYSSYLQMKNLKNTVYDNVDFKNSDNVIYFDCMRLAFSIIEKYSKQK